MIDPTQQDRPFDDLIDDILLKADRYSWAPSRLEAELIKAGVPENIADAVVDFRINSYYT